VRLDNFKQINDSFYHQTATGCARSPPRWNGVRDRPAARYGGEAVVVYLWVRGSRTRAVPRVERKTAAGLKVASRTARSPRSPSAGVAEFPTYANAEALIAAADAALTRRSAAARTGCTSTVQGQDVVPESPARLVSLADRSEPRPPQVPSFGSQAGGITYAAVVSHESHPP
jgi:PleD family two-component response regulator